MKRAIAGVLVISLGLLLKSCDTTEPPPPPPDGDNIENTITLTTLWQDLNKVAVNFTRSQIDTTGTFTYKLKRKNPAGNETEFLFTLLGMDTTFIDENLTKGTYYSYKVEADEQQGKTKDTSRTLLVTTLDTTSHEITWQIDTLGQPGNFLYDVWGLDENNVYAVGYVELQSGNSSIIKWDGIECSLIRNNVVVNRVNIDFAADPTIAFDGLGNGIHTNHPALVNSISSIPGWNFYANNSNVTETRTLPDYSHETQVAGVIAAQQTIYNNYIVKV